MPGPDIAVTCPEDSTPQVEHTWPEPTVWAEARSRRHPVEPGVHQVTCR